MLVGAVFLTHQHAEPNSAADKRENRDVHYYLSDYLGNLVMLIREERRKTALEHLTEGLDGFLIFFRFFFLLLILGLFFRLFFRLFILGGANYCDVFCGSFFLLARLLILICNIDEVVIVAGIFVSSRRLLGFILRVVVYGRQNIIVDSVGVFIDNLVFLFAFVL